MTLRDLTETQIESLRLRCEADVATRSLSREKMDSVFYKLAWSDGVKAILERLDYLPDKCDKPTKN